MFLGFRIDNCTVSSLPLSVAPPYWYQRSVLSHCLAHAIGQCLDSVAHCVCGRSSYPQYRRADAADVRFVVEELFANGWPPRVVQRRAGAARTTITIYEQTPNKTAASHFVHPSVSAGTS
jgi:hypothetical protein